MKCLLLYTRQSLKCCRRHCNCIQATLFSLARSPIFFSLRVVEAQAYVLCLDGSNVPNTRVLKCSKSRSLPYLMLQHKYFRAVPCSIRKKPNVFTSLHQSSRIVLSHPLLSLRRYPIKKKLVYLINKNKSSF